MPSPQQITPEEMRKRLWDAIVYHVGIAIISGLILGGVFAYVSSGWSRHAGGNRISASMNDYRSPKEAIYRPFIWGFVIGSVAGLITGNLLYDPFDTDDDA
jgi:hypothetical protein